MREDIAMVAMEFAVAGERLDESGHRAFRITSTGERKDAARRPYFLAFQPALD